MKNRIFTIILLAILSLPVQTWAADEIIMTEEPAPIASTLDEDIAEQEQAVENEYKQPNSNRKIIKKFLAAMGGVTISSFAIFFLLTIYNRIREKYVVPVKNLDGEVSLETPSDLEEAVKSFLDKTDWK